MWWLGAGTSRSSGSVSLIPWGGALPRMGVALSLPSASLLGEGEVGSEWLAKSHGGLRVVWGFALKKLFPRLPQVLRSSQPLPCMGPRGIAKWFAGEGASSFRNQETDGVYITALFENKPKAAMEDGSKVCVWKGQKSLKLCHKCIFDDTQRKSRTMLSITAHYKWINRWDFLLWLL